MEYCCALPEVIITNFATAILIAIATALKAWTARRDVDKRVLVAAPSADKAV